MLWHAVLIYLSVGLAIGAVDTVLDAAWRLTNTSRSTWLWHSLILLFLWIVSWPLGLFLRVRPR